MEPAMIVLTDEQVQTLKAEAPPQALNLQTGERYILIRQEQYERMKKIIDGPNRRGWDDPELDIYEQFRKKP
jgi:hypothetical protein